MARVLAIPAVMRVVAGWKKSENEDLIRHYVTLRFVRGRQPRFVASITLAVTARFALA